MNIKELSIGDFVMYHSESAMIVGLESGGMITLGVSEYLNLTCGVRHLTPIPLTPEILEKNGWEIVDESADYQMYGSPECGIFFTKGTVRYRLETPQASVVCWNVHQLQHALRLAGIEKEIEL